MLLENSNEERSTCEVLTCRAVFLIFAIPTALAYENPLHFPSAYHHVVPNGESNERKRPVVAKRNLGRPGRGRGFQLDYTRKDHAGADLRKGRESL